MDVAVSSYVRKLIDALAHGTSGAAPEDAARRFDALLLYSGWLALALLTPKGEVIEADENGAITVVAEPMRTMYLVEGAETYPELRGLLPLRPANSSDCATCGGTGWWPIENTRIRCGACRALGWVEVPSNSWLEWTRER
jgi:hypothetical protein